MLSMFLCKIPNESDESFKFGESNRAVGAALEQRPQQEALRVDHDQAPPLVGELELLVGSRLLLGRQAVTQS